MVDVDATSNSLRFFGQDRVQYVDPYYPDDRRLQLSLL